MARKQFGTDVALHKVNQQTHGLIMRETAISTDSHLFQRRNRTVAKSFFRHLKNEGFTNEQIIELSTTLLDLVTADLREEYRSDD
jgi:hypothetical protein